MMLSVLAQRTRTVISGASTSSHHGLDGIAGAIAHHYFGKVRLFKANPKVSLAGLTVFRNGFSCKAGLGFKVGYVLEAGQGGLS